MPNHITNIIEINNASWQRLDEILEAIKVDEIGLGSIDFNKIIPMPDNIYYGNLGSEKLKKYGENNWYDWSIKNWGSKWNSYGYDCFPEYEAGNNTIQFNTAWSCVNKILEELSKMYPDVEFKYKWADEDFGYNVGYSSWKNGEYLELVYLDDGSKEAYEFAAEVMDIDLADLGYELSENGTTYIYVNDTAIGTQSMSE